MTFFFTLIIILAMAYALFLGGLYACQRFLMYHPHTHIEPPAAYGLTGFAEYFTPSSDNVRIQLWYRPAAAGMPTVVYYHGNAYHMGNRAPIYTALAARGFGVLAVSYRGYGKSSGHPSEQGIYDDARAALRFLTHDQHIPIEKIILFGESLGTGVAVQMATEHPVAALILQAAYTSVAARAAELYFYAPVAWLIQDKYHSLAKIPRVKAPLLLLHGEQDNVIPIRMGKALFDAATSPKEAVYFPNIGHNDFDSETVAEKILAFAKKHDLFK